MNEQENQPEIRDATGNPGNNPGNSGIPDPRGPEWYKQMYQSIHKKNKHNHYNNRVTSNYTAQSIFFFKYREMSNQNTMAVFSKHCPKIILHFLLLMLFPLNWPKTKCSLINTKFNIFYLLLLFFLDFL